MKIINKTQIDEMDKLYRSTFINSLPGYKCLQLVGTINEAGVTNLSVFNSIFHLGANPALLGMVVRPDSAEHNTLQNIQLTGQYTLNNVLPEWFEQAHQTSARFPKNISEFTQCGFEEQFLEHIKAPFVAQSTIKMGLELQEIISLSINNTKIIIGEITHVIAEEQYILADGYVDHLQARTVTVAGLDSYFDTQSLGRMAYAKYEKPPQKI